MIGKRKYEVILDPKLCFDLWIETGSVYKVPYVLQERHGVFNKRTGKPVSQMGVWTGAWKYTLANLVESRKLVTDVWKANGELLSDSDWYTLVVNKAKYIYTEKKFKNFLETNSYLTPYLK
jgi:hypothetical protein